MSTQASTVVPRRSSTMIIDAENMDGVLSEILHRCPTGSDRLQYDRLMRWCQASYRGENRAIVVVRDNPKASAFHAALKRMGFQVAIAEQFAARRGVCSPSSREVVDHVCAHLLKNSRSDVVIAVTHDGYAAAELSVAVDRGADAVVVGFPEYMNRSLTDSNFEVVDAEIIGCYPRPLDRFVVS